MLFWLKTVWVFSRSYSGEAISLIFSYSNGTYIAFNVCSLSMEAFKYKSLFKNRISDVQGSYFFVILGDGTIYWLLSFAKAVSSKF